MNSVRPSCSMTSEIKFEVNRWNDSKDIAFRRGIYSIYLKSSFAAILFLADGPKSIASVILVFWYHISNLKSIGETVLKISRSQVGRTEGQTDRQTDRQTEGWNDGRMARRTDGLRFQRTKMCYYLSLGNVTFFTLSLKPLSRNHSYIMAI